MAVKHESQHMIALERANHFRISVARECERIAELPSKEGIESVAQIIEGCDDEALLSGRVSKYLSAPNGIGRAKVGNLLAKTEIRRADKRLRDLTDRQRREIAQAVRNGYKFRRIAA